MDAGRGEGEPTEKPLGFVRRSPEDLTGSFLEPECEDTRGRAGKNNQTPERRGSGRAAWGQCQVGKKTLLRTPGHRLSVSSRRRPRAERGRERAAPPWSRAPEDSEPGEHRGTFPFKRDIRVCLGWDVTLTAGQCSYCSNHNKGLKYKEYFCSIRCGGGNKDQVNYDSKYGKTLLR